MAACPSCRSPLRTDAVRCDRCGAPVARGPGAASGEPPLELMLDEPPQPPKRPPPAPNRPSPGVAAPAAPAPPRAPAPAALPKSALADVDLDLSSGSAAALPAQLSAQRENAGALRIGADGQLIVPRVRPAGAQRAGLDEDGHDPYEIRAFADYGDPPAAFYLAPLYSLRVRQRQKELRAELDTRMAAVKATSGRIDDAVVAFGERVRPIAAQNPIYMRAVAPIEEAERLVGARDAGLAAEMKAYKATTGELDARLSDLEAKLHRIGQDSAALEAELTRLEDAKKRAEAKAKRAEIELRSAEQSLSAGDASSGLKLHAAEKTHERDAQLAEAARLVPLIAAQAKKLEEPRAARLAVEREIDDVRRQRTTAEQRLKRQTGTREAGVEDARKKVSAAIAEFARVALTDAKTFGGEFDASRKAIEALLLEQAEKERAVLMVEKAIACADEAAVKRGVLVAVLGTLAALLLILGLPIYRMLNPPKPPPLYPVDE